jgi:hypothetical protein
MFVAALVACAPLAMAQAGAANVPPSTAGSSNTVTTSGSPSSSAKPPSPIPAGGNSAGNKRALGKVAGKSSRSAFNRGSAGNAFRMSRLPAADIL